MLYRTSTLRLLYNIRISSSQQTILRTLSSSSLSSSSSPKPTRTRLAIGGSKLSQIQQDGIYPSVIATSLQNSITTFESGLNGDSKLKRGYVDAVMYLQNVYNQNNANNNNNNNTQKSELTGRFGYRTATGDESMNGDIMQEPSENGNHVYHNLSTEYVSQVLEQSSLVRLYQGKEEQDMQQVAELNNTKKVMDDIRKNMNLIYMAHNPEAQGSEMYAKDAPIDDIREFVKEQMIQAFIGLEYGVSEGQISSYGVCSNGLGLPSSHPLHLDWEDIFEAANQAALTVHGNNMKSSIGAGTGVANLSMVQLPINLLETHGLKVANRMKNYLASIKKGEQNLPQSINVYAMRPLTAYPDRGTGTGHPFKLVDYMIPTKSLEDNTEKEWTHLIQGSSLPYYTAILNETMAHFDATHILEIKEEEERELTMEERETLDGCKLLQSMIHDLDTNSSTGQIRSFAAYEEDLYTKIVPLIHDTFEELDDESADLLQKFFQAHGNAVRHSIAKTTRQLLREGGDGVGNYDIDDDVSLQEYALQYLWEQECSDGPAKGPLIDKVVVGCPQAEHVIEAVKIADKVDK